MAKLKWKWPKGISWSNHVINFVSVLIGVLIAFVLSDWNQNLKEQKRINVALGNLQKEINQNLASTESAYMTNKRQHDYVNELYPLIDDDFNPIVEDSIIDNIKLKYFGQGDSLIEIGFLELDLFGPSNVAWKTFLEADILNSIDFELAMTIQETYQLQSKISKLDDDIIDEVKGIGEKKETILRLLKTLNISNELAKRLMDEYYPKTLDQVESYLDDNHR